MSEYLIQDSTLTDIADAIRAKDGSSAPILTEDMADAIAAIPSGGGWELIAEATTTEDVEAFRVDIPAAKQNMAAYIVQYDCTLLKGTASSNNFYGCPRLNSVTVGTPYATDGKTQHYTVGIATSNYGTHVMLLGNGVNPSRSFPSAVEYVAMVGYYAGNLVAAGSTIKVYGIGEPS